MGVAHSLVAEGVRADMGSVMRWRVREAIGGRGNRRPTGKGKWLVSVLLYAIGVNYKM